MKVGGILLEFATKQGDQRFSRADSRKRFGKDLLRFYEDLERYVSTCRELIAVIQTPNFGQPDRATFVQELDKANELSGQLVEVLGRLMKVVWPILPQPYSTGYDLIEGRPGRHAERRATALSIYDEQLVELVAATYRMDMGGIWLARSLNELFFDAESREVWARMPVDEDDIRPALSRMSEPDLAHWSIRHGLKRTCARDGSYLSDSSWEPPYSVIRVSLLEPSAFVDDLVAKLQENVRAVSKLRGQLKAAIAKHFTIDDLL